MSHNRQWMYRRYEKGRLRMEFVDGVETFIEFACSQPAWMDGENIKCPCNLNTCQNMSWLEPYAVRHLHLAKYGFVPNYYTWKYQGETSVHVSNKTVVDGKTNLDGEEENFEANSKETSKSQAVEEEVDDDEHDFKTWEGFLRICDPKRDGSFLDESYKRIASEVRARAEELGKPSPICSTKRRRVNWTSIYLDVAGIKDLLDDVESGSDVDTESSCGSN